MLPALLLLAIAALGVTAPVASAAPCDAPVASAIACENSKPGNPASEWDVAGAGDSGIQGFATDISVNQGEAVHFKINSVTNSYRIDIYRMGYYGGLGARKVGSVTPLSGFSVQPACMGEPSTGLTDCGNWSESASWGVPSDAVSGVYIAKLVRLDTGGSSHIIFVVRNDTGQSKLLFQTSDTTWQAYNRFGGNSLYTGSPAGRAYKVSYNRPFTTRDYAAEDWFFNSEFPMVRFLERNGYDVSYSTGIDSDRRGAEILEHKAFLSVGHDEYWSGGQRANVEAARAAGVHLAFLSGNEIFWKTRWETSIDSSGTPHRTLVAYKETTAGSKIDPDPAWTGSWRDPRFSPPADGGRPENALSGQLFKVNSGATTAIKVPAADGKMRFWRNTSIATLPSGGEATLPDETLGYEWDVDSEDSSRPAGSVRLSSTTVPDAPVLEDYGSSYAPRMARHNMTLYRAASGALVFGAGTVQWAWGLDATHDRGERPADPRMQQATVNLLGDMNVQPATLESGLVAGAPSTDTAKPTSTITSPAGGAELDTGNKVTISGTASDTGGGSVGAVEVSLDGGSTWHPATGRSSWTYEWTPANGGSVNIRTRAADDSGNLESASAGRTVTVVARCCRVWASSAKPATASINDSAPVELGVKFRAQEDGKITGVRFYKGEFNDGVHVGHLWSSTGTQLAEATFSGETGTGWQQVNFATPVNVTAGTTYIASYHAPLGHYAGDADFFADAGVDNAPLRALKDGEDGANGVYGYGPSGTFPNGGFRSTNYWVDVVFQRTAQDTTTPTVSSVSPAGGAANVSPGSNMRATFSEAMEQATVDGSAVHLTGPGGAAVSAAVSYDSSSRSVTVDPAAELTPNKAYTVTIKGGASGVRDPAGNALASDFSWTFTTGASLAAGCPCSIWPSTATPALASANDPTPVEVGVKFRPEADGTIAALRFYKGATNSGLHVGHLWTSGGLKMAEVTFSGESSQGWQEMALSHPVAVTAGTTYIASYYTSAGNYAVDGGYFSSSGVDRGPLRALQDGENGGNGVFRYGAGGGFPSASSGSGNYWVDVVFEPNGTPDTRPPTVTSTSPADGTTGVGLTSNARATFSEDLDPSSVAASTFELRGPGGASVAAGVSYNAATQTATLDPSATLAASTTYIATLKGGPAGIKDVSGNRLASDSTWSFTTSDDGTGDCPCSIWSDTTTPGTASANDSGSVEVGVKLRPKVDGQITGVRFYKGGANGGSHIGHLWTAGGSKLAEAKFTGESDGGWQQVIFGTPVSVTAGTTYVASYHANSGGYSADSGFFTSTGADRGPLQALRNGVDGSNGVYAYGPAGTFPDRSFNEANYWVDVIFEYEAGGGADVKPPKVTAVSPAGGATAAGQSTTVSASFNEAMDSSTVNPSTVQLQAPGGGPVSAAVSYSPAARQAVVSPRQPLADSTNYTATVKGGAGGVKDSAGNPLAADHTWSFTTAAAPAPPPDDGPGGPILVITKASSPITNYYAEILRAEGLNEFSTQDISAVTAGGLGSYDTVILGNIPLTSAQTTMLSDWVNAGGNLIAMRPDSQLNGLLGLVDSSSNLADAYLKVDTSKAPGAGIVGQTVQFHGTADRYSTTAGATPVATLYGDASTATSNPAVTIRNVGTNGGQAAAFSFDLARSIVDTRQGNRAWEGEERDGAQPVRSDDLFFGGASGDQQKDWVDFNKIQIPQADELQRLLANMVNHMGADRKPLPRFWYLPRDLKAAVVMTGDDHGNGGTIGRFEAHKAASAAGCSVANWECIRSSSYIYPNTPITNAQATQYANEGFEVGVHVTTGCADYTRASLDNFFTNQFAAFNAKYTGVPATQTNRTHCIVWSDWASQPKVELQHGVRLDTTYYYWPAGWVNNRPGMFTGSGLPMRFADKDGTMIDVYQAATQMTDESQQSYPATSDALLDNALGAPGYYGTFVANMHTDQDASDDADAIIASAKARGVPVISARQLLTWIDGRNKSAFRSISWSGNELGFTIDPAAGATGLRSMLPTTAAGRQLDGITRGGSGVAFVRKTIKGVEYAVFDAVAGAYTASYTGKPTASFTAGPNPAPTGTTVSFNAGASSDPNGTIAKYEWDLDGNGTYETNTGATATTSRSYANDGAVTVGLRVTDNDGQTNTTTRSVTITNRGPAASFTAAPSPANTRQTVNFNGAASSDPDGTVAKYEWDLDGNGSYETSTGATATTARTYATVGTITVGLRVTDNDGAANTTTRTLTVNSAYRAAVVGTTGINGFWRLADTGTTAVSAVGTNTGTFTNGPLSTGGLLTGEQNAARNFDGTNDYVNLAPGPFGTPARVSAEAWVRTESTKTANGYHFLVTNANVDFDDGFSLAVDSSNRAIFAVGGRNSANDVVRGQAVSSVALAPNTINHVVGTYDGSQVRIYVNGIQRGNTSFSQGIFYSGSRDLWFGRQRTAGSQSIRALDGVLDEVALYTTNLPLATIQSHYTTGAP